MDFSGLTKLGGKVWKIKRTGYGMMHQKFCVIDGKVAISGTYNWSVNAKNNNDESIFISTVASIIEKYIEHFHKIKGTSEEIPIIKSSIKGILKGFFSKEESKTENTVPDELPSADNRQDEIAIPKNMSMSGSWTK